MSGKRRAERLAKHIDESNAPSPTSSSQGGNDSVFSHPLQIAPTDQSCEGRRSSAVAASPLDQPKPQIDFQFLNFSHPSEAKTGKTRKAVRSHVTKQQHQRENAAAAARRAKTRSETQDSEEKALVSRPRHALTTERSSSSYESNAQSSSTAESPEPSSPATSIYRPAQGLDPTEIYPQEWHPYIARIMEHYFFNLATDIPDLDGPDATGLLRSRFFPFAMTDPASMHAVMLVAASHYGRSRGSLSHTFDLLQLRGMAIREINDALEDPARALSDQLIAAVAKMATYEALFGDRSIFNTHMTGLLRMVSLRGGLPALGLDGLLQRILLWIDVNASHITASHIYFDKAAFPTSAVHPAPNVSLFTGGLA